MRGGQVCSLSPLLFLPHITNLIWHSERSEESSIPSEIVAQRVDSSLRSECQKLPFISHFYKMRLR